MDHPRRRATRAPTARAVKLPWTGIAALLLIGGFLVLQRAVVAGGGPAATRPEFGRVHWLRDLEAGRKAAAKSERPILLLFQEVPG